MTDALAGTLAVDLELNDAKFTNAVKHAGDTVVSESFRMNTAIKGVQQTIAKGPAVSSNKTWMIGNLGNQIGDFAVQIASGTNALRAATQQLPQVLGGFGALGSVLGAVTAVLGAGITAWIAYADAPKQSVDSIKAVTKALDDLYKLQQSKKDAAKFNVADAVTGGLKELEGALNNERGRLMGFEDSLKKSQDRLAAYKQQLNTNTRARDWIKETEDDISGLTASIAVSTSKIQGYQDIISNVQNPSNLGVNKDAIDKQNDAFNELIRGLELQRDEYRKTGAEVMALRMSREMETVTTDQGIVVQRKWTDEQVRQAVAIQKTIDVRDQHVRAMQAEVTMLEQQRAISVEINDLDKRRDDVIKRESDGAEMIRVQTEAVKQSKVEWNALTESYQINDHELRVVSETQRILNSDWAVGADQARKLAEANVQAADDMTREQQRVGAELKKSQEFYKDLGDIGGHAFDTIADETTRMTVRGQKDALSWSNIWQAAIQDVYSGFLKLLVFNPLKNAAMSAVGSLFSGGFGGATGGTMTGTIGTFASGGRPSGISIVGEKGPELFVPDVAGTIVSNDNSQPWLRGGGETTVNVYAPAGSDVQTRETATPGGKTIEVYIDETVGKLVGTPGSRTSRAMTNTFGARKTLQGRG